MAENPIDIKTKKKLAAAFNASEPKNAAEEKQQFKEIIDDVMKTKKGRETLNTLSKLGYSFAFETGNFGGLCCPEEKKILLNPTGGRDYMLRTIVHEGRHAIQMSYEKRNAPEFAELKVADALRMRRAIEADAVAHEMAFVYECKDVLPSVYKQAKEQNLPMLDAYERAIEGSCKEKTAMQDAFTAWYNCGYYQEFYDKWYKDAFKKQSDWGKKYKDKGLFRKEYPAEDVVKMCRYDGEPYMTAGFLNTGKRFSITTEDKREIAAMVLGYASAVPGAKVDKSVLEMYERTSSGELLSGRRKELNDSKKVLITSVSKQKGGR